MMFVLLQALRLRNNRPTDTGSRSVSIHEHNSAISRVAVARLEKLPLQDFQAIPGNKVCTVSTYNTLQQNGLLKTDFKFYHFHNICK